MLQNIFRIARLSILPLGVNEAAVVGIPDDVYGEVAAALVKLDPGSDLDEPKIQALLHKKIAKYKIPKRILITDEIPLTPFNL